MTTSEATFTHRENLLDSGMKLGERGMPLTLGESKLAAKGCRDPYDQLHLQFLIRRVERLKTQLDALAKPKVQKSYILAEVESCGGWRRAYAVKALDGIKLGEVAQEHREIPINRAQWWVWLGEQEHGCEDHCALGVSYHRRKDAIEHILRAAKKAKVI